MKAGLITLGAWLALNLIAAALDLIPADVHTWLGLGTIFAGIGGLVYVMAKLPTWLGGKR